MRYSSGRPLAPSRMPMSSQLAFMHSLLERLAQPDMPHSSAATAKIRVRDLVFMAQTLSQAI